MNTRLNNDEPGKRKVVYTRRSQKDSTEKHKEPTEIKEANLFKYAQKLGFRESNIIVF